MGFIDKLKKVLGSSEPVQQQAEQPMSTSDKFKQFLNSKNSISQVVRNSPYLTQRARNRFNQFSEREQQPAEQPAQQQINLPTKNIGTTANNQSTTATVKFDEKKARETFKKANPNATDEEINNAVARLKANNGQKNLPVQKASTTAEVKEAQKEAPAEIKQQVKDIEAENKNTLGNQVKGVTKTGKDIYEFLKGTPVARTSGKSTREYCKSWKRNSRKRTRTSKEHLKIS